MGGSNPKIKSPPPFRKSYPQGVQTYLANQPALLQGEQAARGLYDPQRIAEQQTLQDKYGPTQYNQQLSALNQLDPNWVQANSGLGANINSQLDQLNRGQPLMSPSMRTALQQNVRGAQDARGNILGAGAGVEEAYALGDREYQMEQNARQTAQGYLQGAQPSGMIQGIAPIAPDRSAAYVDPNAGFQGVNAQNAAYQAQVAAQAANNAKGSNPWGSILGGIGGAAGAYYTGGSPQGTQAGYALGSGVGNAI
jgi:hypothetical protein